MNKSKKILLKYLISLILFVVLIVYLYKQVQCQQNLNQSWNQIRASLSHSLIWIVFFLMFVNWATEALKWHTLLMPVQSITFKQALLSVFAGCSVAMIIPNRTGEIFGRIIFIKKENRIKSISVNALCGLSQLVVTIVVGTIGLACFNLFHLFHYKTDRQYLWGLNVFLSFCILLSWILLMLYFKLGRIATFFTKIPFLKRIAHHLLFINDYNVKVLLRVLFFSLFRYGIFILQYVLIFYVFNINIETSILVALIAVFYLLVTMAPTIGLLELPVRATTGLVLFSRYSSDLLGIQVSIFVIWFINLVIPSILGSMIFFYSVKNQKKYEYP